MLKKRKSLWIKNDLHKVKQNLLLNWLLKLWYVNIYINLKLKSFQNTHGKYLLYIHFYSKKNLKLN